MTWGLYCLGPGGMANGKCNRLAIIRQRTAPAAAPPAADGSAAAEAERSAWQPGPLRAADYKMQQTVLSHNGSC